MRQKLPPTSVTDFNFGSLYQLWQGRQPPSLAINDAGAMPARIGTGRFRSTLDFMRLPTPSDTIGFCPLVIMRHFGSSAHRSPWQNASGADSVRSSERQQETACRRRKLVGSVARVLSESIPLCSSVERAVVERDDDRLSGESCRAKDHAVGRARGWCRPYQFLPVGRADAGARGWQ